MMMEWTAKWIWGEGEESPRNEWRCFRKTFQWNGDNKSAILSLTADSRYELYVNGQRVGRGPVRSWPFELAYDSYEVGHLLRQGSNQIAVMVLHFGVSNFYYLRGRGGLLAQLTLSDGAVAAATDATWKTSPHLGQDRRSPRMSCQHGFVETIDARAWSADWISASFDDNAWNDSLCIGAAGMEPWTKLVPRDIPLLTEEQVYPPRIISLHRVKPIAWSTHIDMRNQMLPDSVNHANHVGKVAYIATALRLTEPAAVTFGFLNSRFNFGAVSIDGFVYEPESMRGEFPQKYVTTELEAGEHFFLVEVTGSDHGDGFHMGIDCDASFTFVSPYAVNGEPGEHSAFVAIGPFAATAYIDHQDIDDPLPRFAELRARHRRGEPLEEVLTEAEAAYLAAGSIRSADELRSFGKWIKPIPNTLVSRFNGMLRCIWKKESEALPVPSTLQNAVIPNREPAAVPFYTDSDTEFIIDFAKEYSGYIEFEVDAPEGTVIELYGYEYMHRGWRQETYRLDNTMSYTCREGRQRYTSAVRRGFRYVMVTVRNASKPVWLYEVKAWQSNYPVAEIGRFHSSDALLNEVWNISQHTTRVCMEDTFVDCPAYEQVFWVGDSRNEAIINYYLFGATDIVKRSLRLVPGSKFMTPYYVNQVPSAWNSVIPNWTFFWAIACVEYYEHSGDELFAKEMWPHIRYTLDHYLQNRDERGLLFMRGWNFFDWAPIDQPNQGAVSPQNMFLVKTLRVSAQLASTAGDEAGAVEYRLIADQLREAVNLHLWSEERLAYIDCIHADGRRSDTISMQTQVVAMLCGIADGEREKLLAAYLLSPPAEFVQIGTAFMSFFYYEALTVMGLTDIMLEDMRRNYGMMIRYGSSTCYEGYPKLKDGEIDPRHLTRSHCHAWSAAPGYFLGSEILGVKRGDIGWNKVIIEPKPAAGVAWAEGAVPLPQGGSVEVAWTLEAGSKTIELWVRVPDSIDLEIIEPSGYKVKRISA